jgi:hypothetical protein
MKEAAQHGSVRLIGRIAPGGKKTCSPRSSAGYRSDGGVRQEVPRHESVHRQVIPSGRYHIHRQLPFTTTPEKQMIELCPFGITWWSLRNFEPPANLTDLDGGLIIPH